jgi:ribosomal protein L11 methyltransferase
VKTYPAIEVDRPSDPDLLLAAVDDFGPIAVEERDATLRIFFSTTSGRDQAYTSLADGHDLKSIDVPDEDWARRSQENLQPVTIGRITVAPPWAHPSAIPPSLASSDPTSFGATSSPEPLAILVVVSPSMGFGTGHHATTRLCLAAMQATDLEGRFVLDVGTGSGVLAIAADLLGASRALGIDNDPDAIQSACENLGLNPGAVRTEFEAADLTAGKLPTADVVTANLTGALLVRAAPLLRGVVRPGGTLILSGLLKEEHADVRQAFESASVVWEADEDNWVCLVLR